MRILVLLLVAGAAWGDADSLVRRAETRIEHGNTEGARELLLRAVTEAPHHARALALLCEIDPRGPASDRLRYLLDARPLDLATAERLLEELRDRIVDLPVDAYVDLERAGLTAEGSLAEAAGPRLPLSDPLWAEPTTFAHGPLRGDAFGTPAGAHRAALREVAARFDREGVPRSDAWARLAWLLRLAGDPAGAEAAIAHAHPATPGEEVRLAACAMRACADPHSWWERNGERVLAAATRGPLSNGDVSQLRSACWPAAQALVDRRDLEELVALVRGALPAWPVGLRSIPLVDLTSYALLTWLPDETCSALESDPDPIVACMRAQLFRWMLQDDLALETLERTVVAHPDCLLAWECLWGAAESCHLRALQRRAGAELLARADAAGTPCDVGFRKRWLRFLCEEGESTRAVEEATRWADIARPDSCVLELLMSWDPDAMGARPAPWLEDPREEEVLADILVDEGRCADLFSAAETWPVSQAEEVGNSLREEFLRRTRYRASRSLLRAAAAIGHWSLPLSLPAFSGISAGES